MLNGANTPESVTFPSDSLAEVPYEVFTSPDQYALETDQVFKGPVWNYLGLAQEVSEPGDYLVSAIAEISIIVVRNLDGELRAMVNRCAHRGALLCLERTGSARKFSCVYHAWAYDLNGNLTNVAFEKGIKGDGGMPENFRKEDYGLRRICITEFAGLLFGSFSEDAPDIEDYLGPEICARIKRVLHKPVRILGRNTQVLPNNWKLYMENVKDSYHASILHLFFTTFRLNRLTQSGEIIVDESGGHHVSYSKIDDDQDNTHYQKDDVRSHSDKVALTDPAILRTFDEFNDGITLQILTVFPGFVLQQVQNSIALRQILPQGPDKTDLVWTYIGFEDDDFEMREHRLVQNNMVGPAGYISMEDGAVGGFIQRGITGTGEDASIMMMGGEKAESQTSRVTEASVRGFWKKYRALLGA